MNCTDSSYRLGGNEKMHGVDEARNDWGAGYAAIREYTW